MKDMSFLSCTLDLVYPPISNQEGEWFWKDEEVREYVKGSKLYMLVHREELKFQDIILEELIRGVFRFKIKMGEFVSSEFKYAFTEDIGKLIDYHGPFNIEEGDKLLRITRERDGEVLYWATPDKILFDAIKGYIELEMQNEKDIEYLQTFDLLYVGISKKDDSFSRLFKKENHHGRLEILSNEYTKGETARMTDELMILLFEVNWFNINICDSIEQLADLNSYTDDEIAVLADAEKAFICLLDTKYNKQKYKSYPKGKDGLFDKGLQGYMYGINYNLTLRTDCMEFCGKIDNYLNRDQIAVQGSELYYAHNGEMYVYKSDK